MILLSGFTLEQWLALLISVVLPALVALVTKRLASPGLKAVTLLLIAAVLGFTTELHDAAVSGTSFDVGTAATSWLVSFLIAVLAHYGLLKPLGLTGSQGAIAQAAPGGLGTDDPGRHSVEATLARARAAGPTSGGDGASTSP